MITHHILYHNPRHYAAFPAVACTAAGEVLVLFRRARDPRWLRRRTLAAGDADFDAVDHLDPRSHLALLRLSATTLAPLGPVETLPPDPDAADQDANLLLLPDNRLLVSGFGWYPVPPPFGETIAGWGGGWLGSAEETGCLFLFWGGYTRLSADGGRSWTPHQWLPGLPGYADLVPKQRPHHGGGVRGRAVRLADGHLRLASYAADPTAGGRYVSHLFGSSDNGQSWRHQAVIARDPDGKVGYAEPALHIDAMGRLVACHRSFGLGDALVTSVSTDGGDSWSLPEVHRTVTGHPFDVVPLPNGRLCAVYGYRHPPRCGIRARIWDPACGESIDHAPEIILRDDGPSRDLGYPWACVLPDGRLLVVYYFCDPQGVRHIAGSVLFLS
jgi:hypothetical protein